MTKSAVKCQQIIVDLRAFDEQLDCAFEIECAHQGIIHIVLKERPKLFQQHQET